MQEWVSERDTVHHFLSFGLNVSFQTSLNPLPAARYWTWPIGRVSPFPSLRPLPIVILYWIWLSRASQVYIYMPTRSFIHLDKFVASCQKGAHIETRIIFMYIFFDMQMNTRKKFTKKNSVIVSKKGSSLLFCNIWYVW
jgi:hypothetical protein